MAEGPWSLEKGVWAHFLDPTPLAQSSSAAALRDPGETQTQHQVCWVKARQLEAQNGL